MASVRQVGPRARLQDTTFSTAEQVLNAAMLLIVPDDQTQRQAIEKLMPYLYVLRKKGCSWAQLTHLLSESGFKLQSSTVRSYYNEMLESRMDMCQDRMSEQILLLAELRKQNKSADLSGVSHRVAAIMEQQRSTAAPKIDELFGLQNKAPGAPSFEQRGPASPAHEKALPVRSGQREPASPASEKTPPEQSSQNKETPISTSLANTIESGFGLLGTTIQKTTHATKPGFFDLDNEPAIPDLKVRPETKEISAATPHSKPFVTLICRTPPADAKQLPHNPKLPALVYANDQLEHPAIPGLILTTSQRRCSIALEFTNTEDGEIRFETMQEKRFRVMWTTPTAITPTSTARSFTQMDQSLFAAKKTPGD